MTSSGWQGFVTQSSAPIRSPRTRWATEDCPVHTTTAQPGQVGGQATRGSPRRRGPSTARFTTTALTRIATRSLDGHRGGEHAVLPAHAVHALAEHLQEPGVDVDDGNPERGLIGHARRKVRALRPTRTAPRITGRSQVIGAETREMRDQARGTEESENSRNSPVTTNATCSPMSTALSPMRSNARATSVMCIAHSRVS